MKNRKKDLIEFFVEIVVFCSLIFIMVKAGLVIEHSMPRETSMDKLFIVLAYIAGFMAVYFTVRAISKFIPSSLMVYLFFWFGGSLISLFRIFVG
jgi:hypothetical protein